MLIFIRLTGCSNHHTINLPQINKEEPAFRSANEPLLAELTLDYSVSYGHPFVCLTNLEAWIMIVWERPRKKGKNASRFVGTITWDTHNGFRARRLKAWFVLLIDWLSSEAKRFWSHSIFLVRTITSFGRESLFQLPTFFIYWVQEFERAGYLMSNIK